MISGACEIALSSEDVGQIHYSLGATAASDNDFQIAFHGKQAARPSPKNR